MDRNSNTEIILVETSIFLPENEFNDNIIPPMGLYYIKSYIEQNSEFQCEVIVADNLRITDILCERLNESKEYIVGFKCMEDNISVVKNLTRFIKCNYSNVDIVLGGPEANVSGEKLLDFTEADFVIQGAGEKSMLDLVVCCDQGLSVENISGVIYRKDDRVYINERQSLILDELPFPNIDYKNKKKMFIVSGRGCPYKCAFCFDGNTRTSSRSINNIIGEIEYNLDKYPSLEIVHFIDDTFTLSRKRVHNICMYFKRKRKQRKISWICEAHFKMLFENSDIIYEMVDAGMIAVHFGIESGDNKILKLYNKNTNILMIEKVVKYFYDAGVEEIEGNIIVGGPNESRETIKNDIKLVESLIKVAPGVVIINTVFLWPYKGTEISRLPEKFGLTIDNEIYNRSINSLSNCVTFSESLNRKEIIQARRDIDKAIDILMIREVSCFTAEKISVTWDSKKCSFKNKWGEAVSKFPYMRNFLYYNSFDDYNAKLEWYPIRTFNLMEYDNDSNLIIGVNKLSGIKKEFLEYSTGKNTYKSIVENLRISLEAADKIFAELNNLMLVSLVRV